MPFAQDSASKHVVEGIAGVNSALFERNMIVLFGTFDAHLPPTVKSPEGPGFWVAGTESDRPQGTIAISRLKFLDELIKRLVDVNRATSIFRATYIVNSGQWQLDSLPTSDQNDESQFFDWSMVTEKQPDSRIVYEWHMNSQLNITQGVQYSMSSMSCDFIQG